MFREKTKRISKNFELKTQNNNLYECLPVQVQIKDQTNQIHAFDLDKMVEIISNSPTAILVRIERRALKSKEKNNG